VRLFIYIILLLDNHGDFFGVQHRLVLSTCLGIGGVKSGSN